MNEREALREQVYGVNSHLHILHALEGLDARSAGVWVPFSPHTIFQILRHMIYWQEITLARLRGENPVRPASAALGWQAPVAPPEVGEWEVAVAELSEGLMDIERLLSEETLPLDGVRDERRGTTAREELLMLLGHNSYHLGQIVLLRRMQGNWPPPRGGDTW